MPKFFLYLTITVLIVFAGCKTNPPTTPQIPIPEYGQLAITSNVDSASIFIDNIYTGQITPATITATVGNHVVRLEKDNYTHESLNILIKKDSTIFVNFTLRLVLAEKIVLIEDFSNVSCNSCVTSNKIIESLKNSYKKKLVVIKYPTNFPSPNDPFYQANTSDCNSRMNYYNILVAPTTKVDGFLTPVSTDSSSVKAKIEQRIAQSPKFKITINDSLGIGNYNIQIKLETIDTTGVDFDNLILHTIVVESLIEFSTPPGSNGETKFYDVMRKMLPSNNGEVLTYSATGTQYYNRQVTLNSGWNSSKLETVVFIQNKVTKEVLQAGSTF